MTGRGEGRREEGGRRKEEGGRRKGEDGRKGGREGKAVKGRKEGKRDQPVAPFVASWRVD
jgi:hypothetical protein